MELFKYSGYIYGEHVAGFVRANNLKEAVEILRKVYADFNMWTDKTVEKAAFHNDVCEAYYGS